MCNDCAKQVLLLVFREGEQLGEQPVYSVFLYPDAMIITTVFLFSLEHLCFDTSSESFQDNWLLNKTIVIKIDSL